MKEITVRRPIIWKSVDDTNVGKIREINEDSILSAPQSQLWAVADGMGGYEAGDVASDMIVTALHNDPKAKVSLLNEVETLLLPQARSMDSIPFNSRNSWVPWVAKS